MVHIQKLGRNEGMPSYAMSFQHLWLLTTMTNKILTYRTTECINFRLETEKVFRAGRRLQQTNNQNAHPCNCWQTLAQGKEKSRHIYISRSSCSLPSMTNYQPDKVSPHMRMPPSAHWPDMNLKAWSDEFLPGISLPLESRRTAPEATPCRLRTSKTASRASAADSNYHSTITSYPLI